jgi:hypothetical protein
MQAVYNQKVTAELVQAVGRARPLNHEDAMVYLLSNEPCPDIWYAEMCYADELFEMNQRRGDYAANYAAYEAKAIELLNAGGTIGNADVCREAGMSIRTAQRYWPDFRTAHKDRLEGKRKVKWKS